MRGVGFSPISSCENIRASRHLEMLGDQDTPCCYVIFKRAGDQF